MIEVRPAHGFFDRRAFFALPFRLYADDPIWTPPLLDDFERTLSEKNPLWRDGRGARELFVAWRGRTAVGRVVAHVHHASNELHHERVGFFGFLDCEDDVEVARALIDAATGWHRAQGVIRQRGPFELTITQCIGAVTAGFDEPASFSQSWSPPYLPRLLEAAGFAPAVKATTFRLDDVQACRPDSWLGEKQRSWLADPDVTLRTWNMSRFDDDLRAATGLLNDAFKTNWGFVPLSNAEIEFMAGPMKRVVRPELTVFLERAGTAVGVGMCLPDFHVLFRRMGGRLFPLGWAQFLLGNSRVDAAVGQFIATSPALQNQGLMRIVLAELVRQLQRSGFRTLDGTWITESNVKSRASVMALGMRPKHELCVYERAL